MKPSGHSLEPQKTTIWLLRHYLESFNAIQCDLVSGLLWYSTVLSSTTTSQLRFIDKVIKSKIESEFQLGLKFIYSLAKLTPLINILLDMLKCVFLLPQTLDLYEWNCNKHEIWSDKKFD